MKTQEYKGFVRNKLKVIRNEFAILRNLTDTLV